MKKWFIKNLWPVSFSILAFLVRLPLLFRKDFVDFPEFFRDYYMVRQISLGHIPLLGPPSMQTQFHFGAIYYYLSAPLFILFKSQAFSLVLTGIVIYAIGAFFFYKLLKLWFFDGFTAAVGTLFYCLSIYGIHLTSYISNPNFLPLFVILFFYCLTLLCQNPQSKKLYFLLGIIYGVAAQIHTTAAIVLGLSAIYPVLQNLSYLEIKQKIYNLGLIVLATLLINLPYFIFELTHNFLNTKNLFVFAGSHVTGSKTSIQLVGIKDFFSSVINPFELKNGYSFIQPNSLYILILIAAILFTLLIIFQTFRLRKQKKDFEDKLISTQGWQLGLSWLISCMIMLALFSRALHDHYFIIFWPLPAIAIAAAAKWLYEKLNIKFGFALLFSLIAALQIYSFYSQNLRTPWNGFYKTFYEKYENNPNTPEIGISVNQQ